MSLKVRRTLFALVSGALLQRLALLGTTLVLARGLDLDSLGLLAIGLQVGSLLGLLASAGPRAIAAREAAAADHPDEAFRWIQAARRLSLMLALGGVTLWSLGVWLASPERPLFWLICGASALTGVRDLKGLADALGATRVEVRLESAASFFLLCAVGAVAYFEAYDLVLLASLYVASRAIYVIGAEIWVSRRCTGTSDAIPARRLGRAGGMLSLAQVSNQFLFSSDLLLLGVLAGPGAAALYHVAQKIALAAEVPLALLGRLVQPHLNASASGGDPGGTLERVLRASAYLVFPIAAGGWLLAEPLLIRFYGHRFDGAAWTLRWLLAASVAIHVGSRYGNMLFARKEHRPYVVGISIGMAFNIVLTLWWIPLWGPSGSAAATTLAAFAVAIYSALELRKSLRLPGFIPFARPLALACAVTFAAAITPPELGVLMRVGAGALVFAIGLWVLELRRGLGQLGSGLAAASRFQR